MRNESYGLIKENWDKFVNEDELQLPPMTEGRISKLKGIVGYTALADLALDAQVDILGDELSAVYLAYALAKFVRAAQKKDPTVSLKGMVVKHLNDVSNSPKVHPALRSVFKNISGLIDPLDDSQVGNLATKAGAEDLTGELENILKQTSGPIIDINPSTDNSEPDLTNPTPVKITE
jgi:hypothetical protein